ncbi:Purine nucleoside phosphorylase 1 [Peptoniphilus harei]|uniref:purine-nucleoside phosphorylase n=1 Tax=Peptoniphilus harei TaxID=54005 RepID=UPI000F6F2EC5|nr:purine-nucleoside phosphorylase [Peptoniphilus harei]MDU1642323.1 purine-nucleoside phosphorylase [Peptoniphilus harei]MDU5471015.1 purine-nucleoside phosphorylase [Peptoniphilus harei]MDU6098329.1 purine-nucleoside phosphorylase [Peptoniphilus harei]MDU6742861.1 purine-nucleoside phosphorylase [Peptoniphilus harei]QQE47551.1 purine-nucleoside phosphorylase [Peptoniphilus harei]
MNKSIDYIKGKIKNQPEIGIVLGSGLGDFADAIEDKIEIPYTEIPGFPVSTVKGHDGKLIFGKINSKEVCVMKGRIHYYEGYDIKEVVYPIEVLAGLGIKTLILTNAAGGVNTDFEPADLMIINDHINIMGKNPLIGPNDEDLGPRFPDMTDLYNKDLIEVAEKSAKKLGIDIKEGVYMYFTGPSYETAAEVRMARILGADAVGMSTVPEAIIARHRGLKILGISTITNMSTGILDTPLDHTEVVEVGQEVAGKFKELLKEIIEEI